MDIVSASSIPSEGRDDIFDDTVLNPKLSMPLAEEEKRLLDGEVTAGLFLAALALRHCRTWRIVRTTATATNTATTAESTEDVTTVVMPTTEVSTPDAAATLGSAKSVSFAVPPEITASCYRFSIGFAYHLHILLQVHPIEVF